MTQRAPTIVYRGQPAINEPSLILFRAIPNDKRESVGPFVFIDYYRTKGNKGIGDKPHPHAGIEVISYMLSGAGTHYDSMGNRDVIGDGDAQFIKSGKGMIHKEIPNSDRQGLQLWTSLPPEQKFDNPEYASYKADTIPAFLANGNPVKVVSGVVNGHTGPLPHARPTVLAHVHFTNHDDVVLKVDPAHELGVYVIDGMIDLAGQAALQTGDLAILNEGDEILLRATSGQPADVVILGGEKITYPLHFDGPFVMDSRENIQKAYQNYASGGMGSLDGVPF